MLRICQQTTAAAPAFRRVRTLAMMQGDMGYRATWLALVLGTLLPNMTER